MMPPCHFEGSAAGSASTVLIDGRRINSCLTLADITNTWCRRLTIQILGNRLNLAVLSFFGLR
jgi:aerobic-type carbon monoxide dehydrogenase small subunit (CoxS/CutS family)